MKIIFRRIGGRIVPMRVGKGIRVVEPSLSTRKGMADQLGMAREYANDSGKKLYPDAWRKK